MNNDIQPRTYIRTRVSQTFDGINYSVPEWKGFSHEGKPVQISRVTIAYDVDESGISEPMVSIRARLVKRDGTVGQDLNTKFWDTASGGNREVREELIRDYGSDVLVLAVQTSNKLYG